MMGNQIRKERRVLEIKNMPNRPQGPRLVGAPTGNSKEENDDRNRDNNPVNNPINNPVNNPIWNPVNNPVNNPVYGPVYGPIARAKLKEETRAAQLAAHAANPHLAKFVWSDDECVVVGLSTHTTFIPP